MIPPTTHGLAAAPDGTRIAYATYGEGPAIVLTNGFATSSFYWDRCIEILAPSLRVVTWDLRGHGDSQPARDLSRCTVVDCVGDLRAVMDAAGVETATLAGFSLGCQIILEAWRHLPDRIEALVAVLGTTGRPFQSLLHPTFGAIAARAFERLGPVLAGPGLRFTARAVGTRLGHALNQRIGLVGRSVSRARMELFCDHLRRIDPDTWVALGVAADHHDASDLLATITVPALVVRGGADLMTPPARATEMVERIPGCRVLDLPAATHTGLYEYPDEIAGAVLDLLHDNGVVS